MLAYGRFDHLDIMGYSDSNFVGCLDSRRTTLGYVSLLTKEAMSWKNVKQSLITTSTMEADFITCYKTLNQGI